MKEIAISQGKFAMVDDEDFESLSKHTWCYLSGYAVRHSKKDEGKKRLIFMHRQIVNAPDRRRIFHVDGNRLNCQKENIRVPPPTVKKTVILEDLTTVLNAMTKVNLNDSAVVEA